MTLEFLRRAAEFGERTAVVDPAGRHTYRDLLDAADVLAEAIWPRAAGAMVAWLAEPGSEWVVAQWAIWRAGGTGVPLAVSHPEAELEHVLTDCRAGLVLADAVHAPRLRPLADRLGVPLERLDAPSRAPGPAMPPAAAPPGGALVFYTSGTTGKPKGVVLTHANLAAQCASLSTAWEWRADDAILNVLPLHHVHGAINVLGCALWNGAACEFLPRFDPGAAWRRFAAGGLTLFMAVPTVYAKLIAAYEAAEPGDQARWRAACGGLRLTVSGSAALPASVLERWRGITGHVLLERYGMTETGMVLSNPLHGARRPGHVGLPLPGVEVRLVDDDGAPATEGEPGDIEVRGPGVFREYLGRPDETRAAFRDGWFRTGDVAVVEEGSHRILGRQSVDIIKSGGYKLSALEIEEVIRQHPGVADCAVVGVPDAEYGERVAVALVPRGGAGPDLASLRAWGRQRLAAYKLPSRLRVVDALPRNAMGKVVKPAVARLFAL